MKASNDEFFFLLLFLDKILVTTPDIDNIEIAKASGDKEKKKETNFVGRKT